MIPLDAKTSLTGPYGLGSLLRSDIGEWSRRAFGRDEPAERRQGVQIMSPRSIRRLLPDNQSPRRLLSLYFEIFVNSTVQVFQSTDRSIDVREVRQNHYAMNEKSNESDQANRPQTGADHNESPLRIDTRELLGNRREATIIHAGECYRLRVTSNNKLILTK